MLLLLFHLLAPTVSRCSSSGARPSRPSRFAQMRQKAQMAFFEKYLVPKGCLETHYSGIQLQSNTLHQQCQEIMINYKAVERKINTWKGDSKSRSALQSGMKKNTGGSRRKNNNGSVGSVGVSTWLRGVMDSDNLPVPNGWRSCNKSVCSDSQSNT